MGCEEMHDGLMAVVLMISDKWAHNCAAQIVWVPYIRPRQHRANNYSKTGGSQLSNSQRTDILLAWFHCRSWRGSLTRSRPYNCTELRRVILNSVLIFLFYRVFLTALEAARVIDKERPLPVFQQRQQCGRLLKGLAPHTTRLRTII